MKYLALILTFSFLIFAEGKSCCSTAPNKFADLANETDFTSQHKEPVDLALMDHHDLEAGEMIKLKSKDNKDANAFYLKGNSNKYVFVIHEWWGLNQHIKHEAINIQKRLGKEYNVVALDLYDGKVTDKREMAGKYMQEATSNMDRINNIFDAAMSFAGNKSEVATIGWCFGGGMSMQLAIEFGNKAKACVIYYGMPEDNSERLAKLNADVLGIFATNDKWINEEVVSSFESNMKTANKSLEVKSYNADHAFANPSNPGHKPKMAEEAFDISINFIKERLK